MTSRLALTTLLAFSCVSALSLDPASAGPRYRGAAPGGYAEGYLHAVSRHGNGSVSGPVRAARFGPEVRLPGGTWVACRASCSETLRVEVLDIWENDGRMIGAGTAALECGVFGCLELRYPR